MVLNHAGNPMTIEKIGLETFTPGKSGTLQNDLLGAARRNGMLTVPVQGMKNLLTEVAAGHPVIVLQNLAFSWYPRWHYAVVFGYDLDREELTLHSGPEAFKKGDLRKFERTWNHSDQWGMIVLRPGELAPTADDLTHAAGAAALEPA